MMLPAEEVTPNGSQKGVPTRDGSMAVSGYALFTGHNAEGNRDAVKELRRPRAPVLRNRPCDILRVPGVLHLSGSNV